jgi:CheY-like chemotaxis protein
LIVDDDPAIREALAELLEDEGYETKVAEDGRQALEMCRSVPVPDLILLDLLMPVMDGVEFARHKANDATLSHVPICVMTASGPLAPIPPNAAAVLRKPLQIGGLLLLVKRLCASAALPVTAP